jgi:hypothetical protein
MCRRGRRRRLAVHKVVCDVCKRRFDPYADNAFYDDNFDVAMFLNIEYACKPCGEWLIPRAKAAFDAAAKQLLAQVREVRQLERLVLEDA